MLLHQPQQPRSRESQERLLDATAYLLDRFAWEDVSIASIAEEAGMSVGGFYARFKSKQALLLVLHQRYEERRTNYFRGVLDSSIQEKPLPERVGALVDALVDWMQQNRGVLRTFLLRFWSRPDEFDELFRKELEGLYEQAVAVLVGDRSEIVRANPRKATRMAVAVLAATCREALVLKPAPNPGAPRQSLLALKKEMKELMLGYLTAPQRPPSSPGEEA